MGLGFWKQASSAIAGLSPETVLRESEAPFTVALVGSPTEVSRMEDWLVPPSLSPAQQAQSRRLIHSMVVPLSAGERAQLPAMTIKLAGYSAIPPAADARELHDMCRDYFVFATDDAANVAARIVTAHPDLQLALARSFPALREAVVGR